MEISIRYQLGHTVVEPWATTRFYCPCCAAQRVWACRNGGDYYQGEQFMCAACGVTWHWPDEPDGGNGSPDEQRLEAIRRETQ